MSAFPSPFPQQLHRTSPPLRRKASQSEARPPSSVFPWERDDTRSTPRGKAASTHVSSSFTCSEVITDTSARDDGIEEVLKKEIDGKGLYPRDFLWNWNTWKRHRSVTYTIKASICEDWKSVDEILRCIQCGEINIHWQGIILVQLFHVCRIIIMEHCCSNVHALINWVWQKRWVAGSRVHCVCWSL